MEMFASYCYLATDVASYEAKIKRAIKDNNQLKEKERRDFALSHSWENSVRAIFKSIELL